VEAWAERFDHIDDHFMGRHGLIPRSIQDWVPVDSHDMPKQDVLPLRDSDPTQSHENPEDSPQSLEPKSSNGSSPEPTDLAGPSSGNSSNLASTKGGVKRKRTEDGENGSPEKQRRRTYADDAFIYCVRSCTWPSIITANLIQCQCQASHNPRLDQTCTFCEDSHRFCDNCVVEP
jgi:hypothetical protein